MPRLSPSWSVLEAVFDALYFTEIIEEQYFIWWVEDINGMDVEGRMDAIFQVWEKFEKTRKINANLLKTIKIESISITYFFKTS